MRKVRMNNLKHVPFRNYRAIISIVFFGAAFVSWKYLFYIIVVMEIAQIFLGRIYCGFACPYGILQGFFAYLGRRIASKRFGKLIPRRAHEILSCLRYLNIIILLFFGGSVIGGIVASIYAPDVRLLVNSNSLNYTALGWLLFWMLLGIMIERPFCKYVCSGSCFAGAFSRIRLFKLVRSSESCINCKRCERACPMSVPVTELEIVESHNCISCYKCLERGVCPQKGALTLKWRGGKNR